MMIERGIFGSVTLDEFAGEDLKVEEEIQTGCYVRYDVYILSGGSRKVARLNFVVLLVNERTRNP